MTGVVSRLSRNSRSTAKPSALPAWAADAAVAGKSRSSSTRSNRSVANAARVGGRRAPVHRVPFGLQRRVQAAVDHAVVFHQQKFHDSVAFRLGRFGKRWCCGTLVAESHHGELSPSAWPRMTSVTTSLSWGPLRQGHGTHTLSVVFPIHPQEEIHHEPTGRYRENHQRQSG